MDHLEISYRVKELDESNPVFEGLDLANDIPWDALTQKTFELTNRKPKEISLSFCSEKEIQTLNRDYRNKDSVTDVLAFEATNDPNLDLPILGDIVICLARASQQSQELNHSLKREVSFLHVHGLLHLLGYDHMDDQEAQEMFGLQKVILNSLGITDLA